MASEMVGRLARAYAEWLVDDHTPGYEAPARFFLNAIADEVKKEWGKMTWCRLLVTWLRAQAEEAPDDG